MMSMQQIDLNAQVSYQQPIFLGANFSTDSSMINYAIPENMLVYNMNGSIEITSKSPAYVCGEKMLRPALDVGIYYTSQLKSFTESFYKVLKDSISSMAFAFPESLWTNSFDEDLCNADTRTETPNVSLPKLVFQSRKINCAVALTLGAAGSIVMQNSIPMGIVALSCLDTAEARWDSVRSPITLLPGKSAFYQGDRKVFVDKTGKPGSIMNVVVKRNDKWGQQCEQIIHDGPLAGEGLWGCTNGACTLSILIENNSNSPSTIYVHVENN